MSKEIIERMKLGLFVTAGLIFFVLAIYYVGTRQSLFGDTFLISTTFKNVNGLQSGNNVRFSGINVGTVRLIEIINDTTIRVDMVIQDDVRKHIREDALATIISDGLVGNMLVNIIPAEGKEPPIKPNDFIQSYSRRGTEDMLETLNTTNENMALLTTDMLEITQDIIGGKGILGTLLYDTNLVADLRHTVANLQAASKQSVAVINGLNLTIANINDGDGLAGLLLEDTVIRTQIESVMTDLQKSGNQITKVAWKVDEIITAVKSSQGVAGTVVYDSLMANDLKETMHNINEGSSLFTENMEALRHNFFFRKYFKKQEKMSKKIN